MVAPNSTSYPTLAVIQRFELKGEAARAAWRRSDDLARAQWGEFAGQSMGLQWWRASYDGLVHHLGPGLAASVDDALFENVARAVAWCRENR